MFELFYKIVAHFTKLDYTILDTFGKKINDCNNQYENKKNALILDPDIDPKMLTGQLGLLLKKNKNEINIIKLHNNQCKNFINKVMEHYESGILKDGIFKINGEHEKERMLFYNTLHTKLCFKEIEKKLPNNKIIVIDEYDEEQPYFFYTEKEFYTRETGELIFKNYRRPD